MKRWYLMLLLVSQSCRPASPAELPSAAEVLEQSGVSAGLAVVVGTSDGALEAGLAQTERFVVHGLALDDGRRDRARAAIQNRGLYGLASVETWRGAPELPYGDRLANLIVADADALPPSAVPAEAECRRVLAPQGVLYVRRGGKWTRTVQPRPAEMDDWTHYMHGPESNEVSHDTLVGPQTALKWIGWYEKQSTSHMGEYRSAGGLVFHHALFYGKSRPVCFLVARDAFNGVVRWRMPLDFDVRTQAMVAHNGKLFTLLTPQFRGGPSAYVALDARTGKLLRTYDQLNLAAHDPRAAGSNLLADWRAHNALHVDDRFYWVGGKQVVCVDEPGGSVLWRVETENPVAFPAFDKATGRLLVVLAGNQGRWSRWPGVTAEAVLCLDGKSGRELWRCTDARGRAMGQLTVDGDRIMFFNGCTNLSYHPDSPSGDSGKGTGGPSAILGAIRIADGKLLWARQFIVEDNLVFGGHGHWVANAAARDGLYWAMGKNCLFAYDRDGRLVHDIRPNTVNNRCVRGRATDRFFLLGFGGFIDKDFRWTYQNASRGHCAVGMIPANGMTYQMPGRCLCFAYVRGYAGFASDPPPQVADATRLQGGGPAEQVYARPTPAPPTPEMLPTRVRTLPYRDLTVSPQPLRDEWVNNDLPVFWETEPVRAGDLELVAVAHEHRLEARRADKVAWSFTADGRITSPPLVHDGAVYVASHDGFLYALDAATGKRLWRFLAGSPRKMLAYGQLESAQPVTNTVLHEGAVCCAAGRHPELDGGILVWALEPKTGAVRWKVAMRRDLRWAPPIDEQPKDGTFAGYQNVALNRGLFVEDGQLKLVTDPPNYGPLVIDPANPPSGSVIVSRKPRPAQPAPPK